MLTAMPADVGGHKNTEGGEDFNMVVLYFLQVLYVIVLVFS